MLYHPHEATGIHAVISTTLAVITLYEVNLIPFVHEADPDLFHEAHP